MQERRNSSALAMELCLCCINPATRTNADFFVNLTQTSVKFESKYKTFFKKNHL